jgi:chromosome segregation ATPase
MATDNNDRLTELRAQLSDCSKRLGQLEAIAVDALIAGKTTERDIAALEVKKRECRDRIVLLEKAVQQLERQIQLDAQRRMLDQTMAVVSPLVAPLDEAASKLALPPYTNKMHPLVAETIPPKPTYRWPGNPLQGASRWNQRAR